MNFKLDYDIDDTFIYFVKLNDGKTYGKDLFCIKKESFGDNDTENFIHILKKEIIVDGVDLI